MAQTIGNATLTASFATIGTVDIPGDWLSNASNGKVGVRLKHTKHAAQSGGYPVVRIRTKTRNVAGSEVTSIDPVIDGSITVAGAVATVKAYDGVIEVRALTDSTGTPECTLVIEVAPYHHAIQIEAKQAGDTTNFGTLAAELDGRI